LGLLAVDGEGNLLGTVGLLQLPKHREYGTSLVFQWMPRKNNKGSKNTGLQFLAVFRIQHIKPYRFGSLGSESVQGKRSSTDKYEQRNLTPNNSKPLCLAKIRTVKVQNCVGSKHGSVLKKTNVDTKP
jgi:hypothetical protein